MKYVLPLLHSFRMEDGGNCGSVSNDLEIISRGMNKSINQSSSGYLRGNLISLFIWVFYLFSALQGRSRNPKLSRGLGGAVPLSPEPHSGGNVFNGLGRVKERSGPAAYWWQAEKPVIGAAEERGEEGRHWEMMALFSLFLSVPLKLLPPRPLSPSYSPSTDMEKLNRDTC